MEFILKNPFRILGIPVNSKERIVKKTIQNFEIILSIDQQPKAQETDFTFLGKIERTFENVKNAALEIEDPKSRINHSLFWFSNSTSIDVEAINELVIDDLDEAIYKWDSSILNGEINQDNFTSYKNLGVIYTYKAFMNGELDFSCLRKAITVFGKALNSDAFWNLYITNFNNPLITSSANRDLSLKYLFDKIFSILDKHQNNKFDGKFYSSLLNHRQIPTEIKNDIINNLILEKISKIEIELNKCNELCNTHKKNAYNYAIELKNIISEYTDFIKDLLGENDFRFQMISDKVSFEMLNCAILTFNNDIDERYTIGKVEKLLSYAEEYAFSDLAKKKVDENEKLFRKALESRSADAHFASFFENFEKFSNRLNQFHYHPYDIFCDFQLIYIETIKTIQEIGNVDVEIENMIINLSAGLFRSCAVKLANDYTDFGRAKDILEYASKYVTEKDLKERIILDLNTIRANLRNSSYSSDYKPNKFNDTKENKTTSSKVSKSSDKSVGIIIAVIVVIIILVAMVRSCSENKTPTSNDKINNYTTSSSSNTNKSTSPPPNTTDKQKVDSKISKDEDVTSLKETRLTTGSTPYNKYFKSIRSDNSSLCRITLKNETNDDALISLIQNSNDKTIRCVFIRTNEKYTIKNIPPGKYYIKTYTGYSWSNQKTFKDSRILGGFKYSGEFSTFSEVIDVVQYRKSNGISYFAGEWTLYTSPGFSIYHKSTNEDDFFNQ